MSSPQREEKGPKTGVPETPTEQASQREQDFKLKAWILGSEDPVPRVDDVKKIAQEWFSLDLDKDREARARVLHWIGERRILGPPTRKVHLLLPGYDLPLVYKMTHTGGRAPFLLGHEERGWGADTLSIRETCMIKFVEDITNKPEWWSKVRNPEIAQRWKYEALEVPWGEYLQHADFTEEMADFCLEELRRKADLYEQTDLIPVMDYSACAIKSDKILTDELRDALKTAVAPFEAVPDSKKDWHPGSDEKVLDIVHPSLWPLVYGLSHILPDKRVTLENCLDLCGAGETIPTPSKGKLYVWRESDRDPSDDRLFSTRFQWLPSDVDLTGDKPRIESYINNVHPVEHAQLYPVIEKFIEASLPAWDVIYQWVMNKEFDTLRVAPPESIEYNCLVPEACGGPGYECDPCARPGRLEDDSDREEDLTEEQEEAEEALNQEWFRRNHPSKRPSLKNFDDLNWLKAEKVKTSGFFDNQPRIQVIVKLANIHLTPEKPSYDGGSWHVEGQANERIFATALYYYDSENIIDCQLAFRTKGNNDELSQNLLHRSGDRQCIEEVFNLNAWGSLIQNIGSVLTRQGRALFFPNVYQHQVQPFELADKTKPGHRKILALFLVDPLTTVISTSHIPPQQQDWWAEKVNDKYPLKNLPLEVKEMVKKEVTFPFSEKVAKEIREELIVERSAVKEDENNRLNNTQWGFCEH